MPEARNVAPSIWTLIKKTIGSWLDDRGQTLAASLAYYTVFSIAPLLLIVIAVAGVLFGADVARDQILHQLKSVMGEEGSKAVAAMLASTSASGKSWIATTIGIVTLIVGATSVFAELQDTLDHIWRAPAREKASSVWIFLRGRLLSVGMILGMGFLLMVSMVASALLSALESSWNPIFGKWTIVASVLNLTVGFGLALLVFAMIYKVMPRAEIAWRDVWIGAAVTAGLFSVGKYVIGLYIGKSGVSSAFGAAGSLVVLLVWVYYSSMILLIGCEFTWVYAHMYGSRRDTEESVDKIPMRLGRRPVAA